MHSSYLALAIACPTYDFAARPDDHCGKGMSKREFFARVGRFLRRKLRGFVGTWMNRTKFLGAPTQEFNEVS